MVSIYASEAYEETKLDRLVDTIFKEHQLDLKIKAGMKVVLKPNLLAIRDEASATTTHHLFVKSVAKRVVACGASCTVCDSPAGNYTQGALKNTYTSLHYNEIEQVGATLNLDTSFRKVNIQGEVVKNIDIITPILEADFVINLPKLKTHAMMNLTFAVKNFFGIVPGMAKAEMHSIHSDYMDFANAIVDICQSVKPQFTIGDAILAMEGNGPNQGKPRKVGLVIAGENPFEIDFVASKIIQMPQHYAYTVQASIERNLLDAKKISITGKTIEEVKVSHFLLPDSIKKGMFKGMIHLAKLLKPYPTFNAKKCSRCKLCITRCPVQVLALKNNRVVLTDRSKCIRCFCCSEHCPSDAIAIKHKLIFSKTGERMIKKVLGDDHK